MQQLTITAQSKDEQEIAKEGQLQELANGLSANFTTIYSTIPARAIY